MNAKQKHKGPATTHLDRHPPVKVMIIDGQSIFLEGLLTKFRCYKEIQCTPIENGHLALKALLAQPFDILLMDLELPGGLSGWQVMEKVKKLKNLPPPLPRIIILAHHTTTHEEVLQCYRCGAAAFLSKKATAADIYEAIREVHAGDLFMEKPFANQLLQNMMKEEKKAPEVNVPVVFDSRQLEIMRLVRLKNTYEQVGDQVGMAQRTVENWCSRMFHSIKGRNFLDTIAYAEKTGQLKEEGNEGKG